MQNQLKTCRQCNANFEITPEDLAFYDKVSPTFIGTKYVIPAPTLCPECRQKQRLSWRNERKLYNRKCDSCRQQMISMYDIDAPYKVFCQKCWWDDKNDPTQYGREVDVSKPFFEQFAQLLRDVPRINLINKNCYNSDYSLFSSDLKNCYLIFSALSSEDCYYGHQCNWSRDCMDVSFCYESELCYEAVDSKKCYSCSFIQNCDGCTNCNFCYGCTGCSDCFLCTNIVNKQYCIENKQYTKREYEEKMKEMKMTNSNIRDYKTKLEYMKKNAVHRFSHLFNCENCTGDYLRDCKNCINCFDLPKSEDAKYIFTGIGLKDCMDCCYTGREAELCYACLSAFPGYHELFSIYCWESSETLYSDYCFNSDNIFGCTGLKKKQYCILNKQYTKEEYEKLAPKIIEKMRAENQWGEFFPASMSPFAYNETVAQEYFPLDSETANQENLTWKNTESHGQYEGPVVEIPDTVEDATNDIVKAILRCEVTGKLFKIIPQELDFLRKRNLPVPRRCPDQRHLDRLALRNPRHLFSRTCSKCATPIQTTYSHDRSEQVYCEKCYLETVY